MKNTAIIILAAGNSSRLGNTKQLLSFNHKTLLGHVVDEALLSKAELIIVVTGFNAEKVLKNIVNKNVHVVYNKEWESGMASGIVAGVNDVLTLNGAIDKIIFAVCDQPFISADLFRQLYDKQNETRQSIVACTYAETIGTPVLFTKKYFDALLNLKGQEGAKKIVMRYPEDVETITFPQGNIDIDTKQDYEDLLTNYTTVYE